MQVGGHVSSAGGIDTAIDRIEAIGGDGVLSARLLLGVLFVMNSV